MAETRMCPRKRMDNGAVSDTEIFRVVVTSKDPQEAAKIAGAIAYILPKRISGIIEGTSAKIVDSAVMATVPSSPSYALNLLAGFLAGMLLSAGAIILWAILDITIRSEEDILQNCKYPVLAAVPDMGSAGKSAHRGRYNRERKKQLVSDEQDLLIGENISFAAAETYKLLRTKLRFSFADDSNSHVVGVSSALSGEGKSISDQFGKHPVTAGQTCHTDRLRYAASCPGRIHAPTQNSRPV